MSESIQSNITSNQDQSPETYLGTDRRANYVSLPGNLASNQWSLGGEWKEFPQSITATKNSTLRYNFSAKDVYLVLGGSGIVSVKI